MSNINNNFLNNEMDDTLMEAELDSGPQDEFDGQPVLDEALKRIEQAKLYEILLSHKLFSPGSARSEILTAVEKEIRQFVLKRLKVLLGIEQEKGNVVQTSPFSADEVDALKALAGRMMSKITTTTPSLNQVQSNNSQPQISLSSAPTPSLNPVKASGSSPAQTQPKRTRRPRSNNVSQVAVQRPDGTVVNIDHDYSQAVNPANPPKRMPSQAEIDRMNAASVAKTSQTMSMSGNSVGNLLAQAIMVAQKNNNNIKEE